MSEAITLEDVYVSVTDDTEPFIAIPKGAIVTILERSMGFIICLYNGSEIPVRSEQLEGLDAE